MKSVIEVYEEVAKRNPAWTYEQEKDAISRLFYSDKDKFVNEAMKHNLGLVFSAVNKYSYVKSKEDVFQKAVIALVDALRKFDPSKGYKISTWVTSPIKWAVMQAQSIYSKDNTISGELAALNRKYNCDYSCASLDAKVRGDGDSDGDTIADNITINNVNANYVIVRGLDSSTTGFDNIDHSISIESIFSEMGTFLTENEVKTIRGLFYGKNLTEIAKDMNLSKVRISQISKSAFSKIRNSSVGKKLKDLFS